MKSKVEKCDVSNQKVQSYVWLTLKHKFFVFKAGLKVGCPIWRLITHDLSKLGPNERKYYQDFFFGEKKNPMGFARAWLHHQNCNDHHWEYWIPRTGHSKGSDSGPLMKLPMTDEAILEMLSDWIGASRAYGGKWPKKNDWPWLEQEIEDTLSHLHPDTAKKVYELLVKHELLEKDDFRFMNLINSISIYYYPEEEN